MLTSPAPALIGTNRTRGSDSWTGYPSILALFHIQGAAYALFPLLVTAPYRDSGSHFAPQRPNSSNTGPSSLPEAVREY
jgi:hypothetical protein